MTADELGASGPNRRATERHDRVLFAWYCVLGDDDDHTAAPTDGLARTTDFSIEGLGFYATAPLAVGERVFLEINEKRANVSCVGRVVSCCPSATDAGQFRIGVRFVVVPPNARFLLRARFGNR